MRDEYDFLGDGHGQLKPSSTAWSLIGLCAFVLFAVIGLFYVLGIVP